MSKNGLHIFSGFVLWYRVQRRAESIRFYCCPVNFYSADVLELLRLQEQGKQLSLLDKRRSLNHCTQICIKKGIGAYTNLNIEF